MLLEGKVCVEFMRIAMTLSGITLERKTGLYMTRRIKASYIAKDDLARAGVKYKGKPISRRTRIPLLELYEIYEAYYEKYKTENHNVLRENITDYTGRE